MTPSSRQKAFEARLLRVLDYIYANLDGDLSLDRLAEIACMSRFHWHRTFRAITGETLADAVRRIRLVRAANALVHEEAPVAEIAHRFGYADAASFSRAFNAAHGTSPGDFRDRGIALANKIHIRQGDPNMFPVVIRDLPPEHAAGVAHIGPYPEIGKAFQTLGGIIAARNLFPHAKGMIAIYHDAPGAVAEAAQRSHAAVLTLPSFPADMDGLEYFDLVGGKYAVLEHSGPYATLGAAYDWLYGTWLPQSGEEPRDAPPIELYVNNPMDTPNEDLRTDIRLPLK